MAQQVEGVGIGLVAAGGQLVEADATFGQLAQHVGPGVGVGPGRLQRIARGVQGTHRAARVLGVAHDLQLLAVGVEVVDQMADDLDLAAVDVELARLRRRVGQDLCRTRLGLLRLNEVLGLRLGHTR